MYDRLHVYSFDIETDNSQGFGLDPGRSRITQISLATEHGPQVFNGSEYQVMNQFAEALDQLPAGLITTWNGAFFDIPWINERSMHLPSGHLELVAQPGLKPKYDYTPGYSSAYTMLWHGYHGTHAHMDISLPYKTYAESFGLKDPDADGKRKPVVPWSLKPVCEAQGIDMFVIDRTRLHEYSQEDQDRYVASDTVGTRELSLRWLGLD